jgi:hypothetical protein
MVTFKPKTPVGTGTTRPIDPGTQVRTASPVPGYTGSVGTPRIHRMVGVDDTKQQHQRSGKNHTDKKSPIPTNVRDYVQKYYAKAQMLATKLGNGVTAAEVLALSGSETTWGSFTYKDDPHPALSKEIGLKRGNYFGIHGSGTQGYDPAAKDKTVHVAKYSPKNGFLESGESMIKQLRPHLKDKIGENPVAFFNAAHDAGWGTPNQHYAAYMTDRANRGPYQAVIDCIEELGLK